ncbi:MAG: response regulator transcription factor [Armatimonadetes bacterium]|nr:response regulator transcription factor [Armatimonadota bacterium]
MTTKVLVVEDERDIARSLCYALEKEGFLTRIASDGQTAIAEGRAWRPDVVLLDLILPDIDGLSVCRSLRKESAAAIIMVTARTAEVDRVVGLEVGADDYVTKPFSIRELIARVRAVLRRMQDLEVAESALVSGDLELHGDSRKVFLQGRRVDLTLKEFELLKTLMNHKGRVLSREFLYETVWGEPFAVETRTLDVHIHSLREKIEKNPEAPVRIVTLRGVGYRFEG